MPLLSYNSLSESLRDAYNALCMRVQAELYLRKRPDSAHKLEQLITSKRRSTQIHH